MAISSFLSEALIIGCVGGVLSLDKTAALQVMVSRPIVSAPLTGLLTGSPTTGLAVGILLEMLYMADRPVGTYMPVHETGLSVTVTATSVAYITSCGLSPSMIGLGVAFGVVAPVLLVCIPVAALYRKADIFSRHMNKGLFDNACAALTPSVGEINTRVTPDLFMLNLRGLFNFFWPIALSIFVMVFILGFVARYLGGVYGYPGALRLYPAGALVLMLALAMALSAVMTRTALVVFSVSGLVSALLWVVIR